MNNRLRLLLLFGLVLAVSARAAIIFDRGANWRWRPGDTEASAPIEAWRTIGFNDAQFTTAPSPFWYDSTGDSSTLFGGTTIAGMQDTYLCLFFRMTFVISNVSEIGGLRLGTLVDDGYVAWINGTEVHRVNMTDPPGSPVTTGTLAQNALEPVAFEFFTLVDPSAYLVEGTNVLAVQVFQSSLGSSDVGFDGSLESILIETVPPVVVDVDPAPDSTLFSLSQITVTFSEPVAGVGPSDLLVNGSAAATVVPLSGLNYRFTFPQPAYGTVAFTWNGAHGIEDLALPPNPFDGNGPGATWNYQFVDNSPPTVAGLSPAASATVRSLASINVLFSEPVSGVDAADLLVNNNAAVSLTVLAPNQYRFDFPEPSPGTVLVEWTNAHNITDQAAMPNAFAGDSWIYLLDPNASDALPYISEFMASNSRTLADEEGVYSDWIEIYNPSPVAVNLEGWNLTDTTNDLAKWTFPATNLAGDSFLVVFASDQDRRVPGAPLHTNFRLSAEGEYLALVKPDGVSIVSEFRPLFPEQVPDVSYGYALLANQSTLIATGAPMRVLVPTIANGGSALDYAWTGSTNLDTFNDSAWLQGVTGVGFSAGASLVVPTSMVVRFSFDAAPMGNVIVDSKPGGTPHNGLNAGASWVAVSTDTAPTPRTRSGVMEFLAQQSDQITLAPHADFNSSRGTICFWMRSAGVSGQGSFGAILFDRRANQFNGPGDVIVMQDDGRLFVQAGNGTAGGINSFATPNAVNDNRWHHIAYVYDQSLAGSIAIYVDGTLARQQGNSTAWSWSPSQEIELGRSYDPFWRRFDGHLDDFRIYNRQLTPSELVELVAGDDGVASADIGTNLQTDMLNVNASAFIRIPFMVQDPASISLLTLRLKYDDGYVAWINGQELTRGNAPSSLAWNSTATSTHSPGVTETISLGNPPGWLRSGNNLLAIQGLNIAATNPTFLILPQFTATAIAAISTNSVYFTAPTPGAPNIGGAAIPGPVIASVQHTPNVPRDAEDLVVVASVQPSFFAITSVSLQYRIMYNSEVTLPMADDGAHGDGAAADGVFGAVIPAGASTNGQMIRYYVSARDVNGNASRWPLFTDPANTAEYLGTIVDPTNLTSRLPFIHLFINPAQQSAVDSQSGGRAAVFHDGEFYDNISMQVRGNTTAGYVKKSHRLEFNREHTFRHPGPGGRVRKTSLMAEFIDPSYLRQYLSFWLMQQAGHPAPFHYPVHVRNNGNFYQLAFHSEVLGEEQLERFGFDPNGALYKACGVVAVSPCSTGGGPEKISREEELGTADYTELASRVANSLPLATRRTNLFDLLDLPELINYLAVSRLTHEQDDIWANLSLYRDSDGDQIWRAIPFDLNLSWGQLYAESTIQATNDFSVSHPFYGAATVQVGGACGGYNHLFDAVVQIPETRQMFLRRLRSVMETLLQPPGTPVSQAAIEREIFAMTNLFHAEAFLDRQIWGFATGGGGPGALPAAYLTNGVRDLVNQFINPRRAHLFGTHSVTNTARALGLAAVNNAGIPVSQPANAVLRVVEVQFNPASASQAQEYVCLTNPAPFAADISGWQLDGAVQFTFKPGTVVPSNSLLYVSPDLKAFRSRTTGPRGGQALFVVGPYEGQLSARGETLRVLNGRGQTVNTFTYAGDPSLAQQFLRITELMYHPSTLAGNTNSPEEFEFVELRNISPGTTLSLLGVRLTNGVEFSFTGSAITSLEPGARVLVVKNLAAFMARYTGGLAVAGQYTGSLDNGGERVRLLDASNEEILDFRYDNNWYPVTDGLGFSLVVVNENAAPDAWNTPGQWRPSGSLDGNPAAPDTVAPAIPRILVNEALTRTDVPPPTDSIELYHPTGADANITGWWLSDDFNTPKKFRIPEGPNLAAGAYRVFTEDDFNPGGTGFALGSDGDEVWLFSADDAGNLTGYAHGHKFGAADDGVTFGRLVTSDDREHFTALVSPTLGLANSPPRTDPVVINEIMYRPPDLGTNDNTRDEFIELVNVTGGDVPLFDPAQPTNTWRLDGGVDFTFPTNVTLTVGQYLLLVNFDPRDATQLTAFRDKYGVATEVPILGPYNGKLDNSGEDVELKKPAIPATGTETFVLVDKVSYQDSAPWPGGADGFGLSLQRKIASTFGNEPTNWTAALPKAAAPTFLGTPPTITTHPQSQTLLANTNVTLSVSASGPQPLRYQWRHDGANLPTATNSMLQLANVQPEHSGDYSVVLYNNAGSVVSSNATLTVLLPVLILQQPQNVSTNPGVTAVLSVVAYSPTPLRYQWLKGASTLLDATNATLTFNSVEPENTGIYTVVVTDDLGPVTSTPATLTVLVQPVIVQQPLSQSVVAGSTVVLSVGVTNTATLPISSRWRRNGLFFFTNTFNSRTVFLTLTNPQSPLTNYQAIVSNPARPSPGGFQSSNAFLTFISDMDGDGIPDSWESTYFGGATLAAPNGDPDGDTMLNWMEYVSGTNPTNGTSYLKIDTLTAPPSATVSFMAISNRTYTVQFTDALGTSPWQTLADVVARATNRLEVIRDPAHAISRHYRLVTPKQ